MFKKMQPKSKTLIEGYGFLDQDRKKPKHDEIQFWAYRNFPMIARDILKSDFNDSLALDLKLEFPISSIFPQQPLIGFIDIYSPKHKMAIEIKTSIPVVGDLIRQIQFYRQYLPTARWVIICPDDRSENILKSQGILFYKYPDPERMF